MGQAMAVISGRVTTRPFRVAQLIDTSSAEAVHAAIVNLTEAWGGIYMPILDRRRTFKEIDFQARLHDVDAIHMEETQGSLFEELRQSGWLWGSRGPFGPFASDGELRLGALPARFVKLDQDPISIPLWERTDDLDLLFSAVFGAMPSPDGPRAAGRSQANEVSQVPIDLLIQLVDVAVESVGPIQGTRVGLSPTVRHYLDGFNGVFVVRPDCVEDIVAFWNLRSIGVSILAIPADGAPDLLSFLTRGTVPGTEMEYGGPTPRTEKLLGVWGLKDASTSVRSALDEMAHRLGMAGVFEQGRDADERRWIFPGLESPFESSFRADFAPSAESVMVRVPTVPIRLGAHQVMPGIVAVDFAVQHVSGLDPRLTAALPPFRRLGRVLAGYRGYAAEHVRVRADGNGVVLGVTARSDEAPFGFASNLDAIHALFDDATLKVSQSDAGRFQTRAAEMLGGPFGAGVLQPGVRAVIERTARSNAGLTLQQLLAQVKDNRGDWPDKLTSFRTSADDYARNTINYLLRSGLFVPMLDVHCSSCGVESQVPPRDLDFTVTCEFCSEQFRLALSLSLSRSRWRYRLASHLREEKVTALLPALATMSLIGTLSPWVGPSPMHAFGVDLQFEGKRIEVDIAMYLGGHDLTTVLGEVKNSNRIDANDVLNLEELQRRLDFKGSRSVLAFATLKDRFVPEEIDVLRGLVERSTWTETAQRHSAPRLPLVLTGRDLSVPWFDDKHPSKWTRSGFAEGIFGTAIESCKRNLGLVELEAQAPGGLVDFGFAWDDAATTDL